MYSTFQLTKKYLHYYLTASSRKGHGIHSPFVFNFINYVLNDKKKIERSDEIEKLRHQLLQNSSTVEIKDFGAGTLKTNNKKRKIKAIASSSLKTKKYSSLLARIVKYYKPQTILELGTSLGITTSYLSIANPSSTIYTLEGSENIAAIAQNNFDKLDLKNIQLIKGNFDDTLPELLKKINTVDFAFVDGNHRKEPTLNYFNQLLNPARLYQSGGHSTQSAIFIFDDIHWSAEMEQAWQQIKQHPAVTLTIDLFFIGIVFLNNDFKVKQHFVIRF